MPLLGGGILSFHNLTDIKRITADKLLIHIFRYKPDQIVIAALTGLTHAADSLIGLDLNNNPIAAVAELYTYRYDIDYLRIEQVLSNAYKNQGFEPYPGTETKPHFLLTINKFGALYHPDVIFSRWHWFLNKRFEIYVTAGLQA